MDTKKIAELIDKERRLQFDQQSKYMDTLGLPRQNYAAIMKRLKKDNSQVRLRHNLKYNSYSRRCFYFFIVAYLNIVKIIIYFNYCLDYFLYWLHYH